MPGPLPQPPAALHLLRLAKATPNHAVWLPETALAALHLTEPQTGSAGGAVICLEGELLIDFEGGAFVHLKEGEACALPAAYRLMPIRQDCTVLKVERA